MFLNIFVAAFSLGVLFCRLFNIDSLNVSYLVQTIVYMGILYLYKRNPGYDMKNIDFKEKKQWWYLTSLSLTLALIITSKLVVFDNVWKMQEEDLLFGCMLVLLLFIAYVAIFRTIYYMNTIAQNKQEILLKMLYEHQLKDMRKAEEEAKRTRHDFRHHNMVILEYVKNNNRQALFEYLTDYENNASDVAFKRFSNNDVVNSILSAMSQKAKMSNIDFQVEINVQEDCSVKSTDMVAMLSNVLENAFHACILSKQKHPFVHLKMMQKNGRLLLFCQNTCLKNVKLSSKGLPQNKENNGIGIFSILNCVERYHGEVDFDVSEGVFTVRLSLNLPVQQEKNKDNA